MCCYASPHMASIISQLGLGRLLGVIAVTAGIVVGLGSAFRFDYRFGIPVLIIVALVLWRFWKLVFGPLLESERILKIGEPAQAKISKIVENGTSLTMGGGVAKPGVSVALEVHYKDKPAYLAGIRTYLSFLELQSLQIGDFVDVKVDPEDQKRVVLALKS